MMMKNATYSHRMEEKRKGPDQGAWSTKTAVNCLNNLNLSGQATLNQNRKSRTNTAFYSEQPEEEKNTIIINIYMSHLYTTHWGFGCFGDLGFWEAKGDPPTSHLQLT